jgi:hypothetical protein
MNPTSCQEIVGTTNAYRMLPDNSIVLMGTPYTTIDRTSWANYYKNLQTLKDQSITDRYVFIDASCDPLWFSNQAMLDHLAATKEFFPNAKVAVLTSRCQNWFDDIPGLIYYPFFFNIIYNSYEPRPRAGRIGCLNRQNSPHRAWLMHSLLSENLIDSSRDVYSIGFANPYDLTFYCRLSSFIENRHDLDEAIQKYPPQIATHPDNFPNDYTINHPAWHTGIAVVTETHPGDKTLITEKTAKAIISQSCFSIYMAEAGYKVLEELGFEPRFFPDHASETNIEPIIQLCKTIDTESAAMDYRQQHMDKINHNAEWFNQGPVFGPWYDQYNPKFQRDLDRL